MITKARASFAAAAMAATLFAPTSAIAGDDDVVRRGSCSGFADWKLQLSPQDGRIEVEFEVDANRRGQQWRVRLFRDGRRVLANTFTTRGLSGSFTVREVVGNRAGTDRLRARAVRAGGGQTCVGRARI